MHVFHTFKEEKSEKEVRAMVQVVSRCTAHHWVMDVVLVTVEDFLSLISSPQEGGCRSSPHLTHQLTPSSQRCPGTLYFITFLSYCHWL